MCGDFYIGGRQFVSLNDLIGYYTSYSCLLKGEHLVHPVAPPEPVGGKKRVLAKYTYNKAPETDELRLANCGSFDMLYFVLPHTPYS